jgi:predicted RNA-binding Zn-ribbon protein involved in translation (DUF1610 family)
LYYVVTDQVTDYLKNFTGGGIKMASGSKTRTLSTNLQCPECGNTLTIHRKRSKMREKNHVKHVYCYKCKEVTGHVEVKEDIFLPEWLKEVEEEA